MTTFNKSVLAFGIAASLGLSGCAMQQPYGSNDPYANDRSAQDRGNYPQDDQRGLSRTQRNAAIGAGIGAVAGIISGGDATERRQRALIGAGVGGLAGAAVGKYQDRQEASLRRDLADTGVDIVREGDNITLAMPEAITFDFNSSTLQPRFDPVLSRLSDTMREYQQTIIEVAGHTDSVGTESYNQTLSEKRAQSVANALQARGIRADRMITIGGGERYPISSNESDSGRAMNRRVEITLVPLRA